MENMEENFPTKFDKNAKYLLFLIIMNEIALWPIHAINGVSPYDSIQESRNKSSLKSIFELGELLAARITRMLLALCQKEC